MEGLYSNSLRFVFVLVLTRVIAFCLCLQCASLNKYGSNMSCTFVRNAANCQLDDGFIDYFEIIYCDVPHKLVPLIVTVMVNMCYCAFIASILWCTIVVCDIACGCDSSRKLKKSYKCGNGLFVYL